jgi:glycosyltransferase involved in cell wall biosynthesis
MLVSDCFVSVIAPVHNESGIIEHFVHDAVRTLESNFTDYELVIIDDGSQDNTVRKTTELLKKYKNMRLIRLSRTFGEEIAISAGLDSAIGDYVVVMIPNTDPPELIPQIVSLARNGNDIVIGIRNERERYAFPMKTGSFLFFWYCRSVLKLNLPRNSTQFRVFSRQAVNAFMQTKDKHRFLRILSTHVGFRTDSFVYKPINRDARIQKTKFFSAVNQGISMIIKSSTHPLRLVSWLGISAGVLNLFYTTFVLCSYLFGDDIAGGWTTLSLQSGVMFFFVFLILTVLSEYVGHILIETGERPLYFVLEERTSSDLIADKDRLNVVTDPSLDKSTVGLLE